MKCERALQCFVGGWGYLNTTLENTVTGEQVVKWHSDFPSGGSVYAPSGQMSFIITSNDVTEADVRPKELTLPAKPTDSTERWALVAQHSLGVYGNFRLSDLNCGADDGHKDKKGSKDRRSYEYGGDKDEGKGKGKGKGKDGKGKGKDAKGKGKGKDAKGKGKGKGKDDKKDDYDEHYDEHYDEGYDGKYRRGDDYNVKGKGKGKSNGKGKGKGKDGKDEDCDNSYKGKGPSGVVTVDVTSATLPSYVGLQLPNDFEFYDDCSKHVLRSDLGGGLIQTVWFQRLPEKDVFA